MINAADLTEELRIIVTGRVEHQMLTVHASAVRTLLLSGMTRDEIRDALVAKILG